MICPRYFSKSVSEQGKEKNRSSGSFSCHSASQGSRLSLLGTQVFCFIRGHCWTAVILVIHFHPNSMRNASLWSLPTILQFFRTRTPTFLSISGHLPRQRCPRYPAPGKRSFFLESERRDGLFPSLRDCRIHSCPCGRLPIIKEELMTCYAPDPLPMELFSVNEVNTSCFSPSFTFYFPAFFSLEILALDWNWKSLSYAFLCCFRVMETSLFPQVCTNLRRNQLSDQFDMLRVEIYDQNLLLSR